MLPTPGAGPQVILQMTALVQALVTVTVILCNVSSVPAAGCGFLSSGGRCVAYTQCAPFLHLLDTVLKPVDPRIGGE